jgi:hypothetical protein
MPKKKSGAAAKSPSKTAFVLGLPQDMPVSDVLAKAKEAGITIAKNYVYLIRSKAKSASTRGAGVKAPRTRKPSGRRPGASAPRASSGSGSIEAQFANIVAEIGLARAEQMLRTVRAKFTSASS